MFFLAFNNIHFQFGAVKLTQRSYIIVKALSTTNKVEIIDKKEFGKAALDENSETFIVYITTPKVPTAIPIHSFQASQVQDNPILVALQWDKAPIKILVKYSDYDNICSTDLAIELPKNISINKHVTKLIKGK